jgi:hypothetical protein
MHVTAASYSESLKNLSSNDADSMKSVLAKMPKLIPIDEIKVLEPESQAQEKKKEAEQSARPIDWIRVLIVSLLSILWLVLMVFITPTFIYWWYRYSAATEKEPAKKAFKVYRLTMYYLNQMDYYRTNMGPRQYAKYIDGTFNTDFEKYSNIYQRLKYGPGELSPQETTYVNSFFKQFRGKVTSRIPYLKRRMKFYNIYNTIHFFTQPKIK